MNQILIFITTFIIQFVIAIEMNLIGPLAPFLSTYFNIADNYVILFNLGYSAVGILVPYLGIISDRFGKKKMLSAALIMFIIGTLIAGISNNPLHFALGRIFIGLGYYSLSGTNLSYISEFIDYDKRGKASGILRIAFGIAVLISPLYSATLIARFSNILSVYLPLTILGILALLLLIFLPETTIEENKKFDKKRFFQLLQEPKNLKIFISIFFITTAPSILLNFLGIHMSNEFGLTQVQIGFVYTLIAIGTLLGIGCSAIFTDRLGKLNFSSFLFGIMVISLFAIPYINSLPITIILCFLFAFGLDGGWTSYQAYATEISPENRGTFMSLFYTVNALTVTFYSIFGSIIYSIGGFKLSVGIATLAAIIGFSIVYKLNKNENKKFKHIN